MLLKSCKWVRRIDSDDHDHDGDDDNDDDNDDDDDDERLEREGVEQMTKLAAIPRAAAH